MEEKTIINSITCDEGSEFTNLQFRKFCRDKNIEIYFTKNDKYKLGIVNDFIEL
jgi:IS30 family transposase